MSNVLLVNAAPYEIRIALVEHGNLVEYYLERPAEKGLVGNIYLGKVVRVLPGMQAAFVDIGLERTGFLYVDDVLVSSEDIEKRLTVDQENSHDLTNGDSSCVAGALGRQPLGLNIDHLLKEGQTVLVQIFKEPMGTKGARLTSHITLPCRNLVFMPTTDHIGISRKIEDEEIRQQLRDKIEGLRPQGTGFIVRTMAENASSEELEADMEFLLHLWSEIQDTSAKTRVPGLVYEDLDITLRTVRDLLTPEIHNLVVDEQKTFDKILNFVKTFAPEMEDKVTFYEGTSPVLDAFGVEVDISRALEKKVWLRSGGYIIIETTEALTVIDVNTGRFVGKSDLEDTIFKTNMEAVKEIAYQLRLRNIGGLIIIDFIDMEDEGHREKVFTALQEAVKKDKSRVNILKVSEFGLVQMTRKRNRENLSHMMCEPCLYCAGEGYLKSRRSICYDIFRKITHLAKSKDGDDVMLKVHPMVADMMLKEEASTIYDLEQEINKRIIVVPTNAMHIKKYDLTWKKL
jgi:ribonuclease G